MVVNNLEGSIFESVLTLRKVLGETNLLQIIHPGNIWQASFDWSSTARNEDIAIVEADLGRKLPEELVFFYTTVSDGARLYYDIKYGQWGYIIYGSGILVAKQEYWRDFLSGELIDNFLVIGESIDDRHPLLLDLEITSSERSDCRVIEGNPLDPVKYWKKMSSSFHEWIEHLITSQGAKYWDWQ